MDTFEETHGEWRNRFKRNMAIYLFLFIPWVVIDFLVFSPRMELAWGSYIFPVCILIFIFLIPQKRYIVTLSESELSTTETAYPIEKITKIEERKSKYIIHATGMSNWHLPRFTALDSLPNRVVALNPNIEVLHGA